MWHRGDRRKRVQVEEWRNANRAVRVLRGLVEGTGLENPGHFSSQNDCIRHRPDEAQLGDIQHVSRV